MCRIFSLTTKPQGFAAYILYSLLPSVDVLEVAGMSMENEVRVWKTAYASRPNWAETINVFHVVFSVTQSFLCVEKKPLIILANLKRQLLKDTRFSILTPPATNPQGFAGSESFETWD